MPRRSSTDARSLQIKHRHRVFDVRIVSPEISADGRDIHPSAKVIRESEIPLDREVIVRGWLVPATFEVTGRDGVAVTFAIDTAYPPAGGPIVISAVQISQRRQIARDESSLRAMPLIEWGWPDLPPVEALRDAAITLASVWVRIRVPSGGWRISSEMTPDEMAAAVTAQREWMEAAKLEVIGLANAIPRADLDLLTGRQSKKLPPFDSAMALREVARLYEEAYRDGGRPIAPIESYIANRTYRAVGTVRRQITMARERGYIVDTAPPRRAVKSRNKRGRSR